MPEKQTSEPRHQSDLPMPINESNSVREISFNQHEEVNEVSKIYKESTKIGYDDSGINSRELHVDESAVIEIDDPELKQLLESEDFLLHDYVSIPNNVEPLSSVSSHLYENDCTVENKILQTHNEDAVCLTEEGLLVSTGNGPINPRQEMTSNETDCEDRLESEHVEQTTNVTDEVIEGNISPGINENILLTGNENTPAQIQVALKGKEKKL